MVQNLVKQLAHLFGRFRLPSELSKVSTSRKMQKFFSKSSQLQTLAGFAMDESPGCKYVMDHMKGLRKVKIWCDDDAPLPGHPKIQLGRNIKPLSVDFGDRDDIISFLDSMGTPPIACVCESIKLKGKLDAKLPDFMLSLNSLQDLRLLSFDLDTEALVELGS